VSADTPVPFGESLLILLTEKCFADPIMPTSSSTDLKGTPSSDAASRPPPASSEYPSASTTLLGDRAHAQWGLTISGFYYVALHRQTGRIDGLYYDPGSQPYQSLTMVPEGCRLPDEIEEPLYVQRRKTAQEEMQGTGLKKWFPAVEFR
jgi:Vacuolar import and degradation protein